MRKYGIALGFVFSAASLFAQLDSNSVTVTASRGVSLQPDQVVFSVRVDSDLNTGLDDVLAALQGSGITLANFNGVGTTQLVFTGGTVQPRQALEWAFTLPAPLSKIKETAASLATLQQNIARQHGGLSLSFSVQGTTVSPQLLQSQSCSLPDLLADARAQAQKLAGAAGFTADTILAMSSATAATVGATTIFSSISSLLAPSPVPCTITVKFSLARFQ